MSRTYYECKCEETFDDYDELTAHVETCGECQRTFTAMKERRDYVAGGGLADENERLRTQVSMLSMLIHDILDDEYALKFGLQKKNIFGTRLVCIIRGVEYEPDDAP